MTQLLAAFLLLAGKPPEGTQPASPVLVAQSGHSSSVTSASFSPTGALVLTSGWDGTAILWDSASGRQVRTLRGHGASLNGATFSADGTRLLTASSDGTARLWDAASGKEIRRFESQNRYMDAAAISGDGRTLATAEREVVRIWDAGTGRERLRLEGHAHPVNTLAFSKGGETLLTASLDGTARIWNAASGAETRRFAVPGIDVSCAAFSPDPSLVATGGSDGSVRLWDAATGRAVRSMPTGAGRIESVAFSPDGSLVASASGDQRARIWSVASGTLSKTLEGHSSTVFDAEFSPDGRLLVTAGWDGTARIWDVATGRQTGALRGYSTEAESVDFSPDGRWIVVCGSDGTEREPVDGTARLWDARTGQEVRRFSGHSHRVLSARFSPDGSGIVTSGVDGSARLWDLATGSQRQEFVGAYTTVYTASVSPDGKHAVVACQDGTARVHEVESGRETARLSGHQFRVSEAAFSPDGATVLTAGIDGTVRLWDWGRQREIRRLGGTTQAVWSVRFSPDGSRAVTSCRDGIARVWSVADGTEILRLVGHDGSVASAVFSADGSRIATAGDDGTVRIWDAASGREEMRLRAGAAPFRAVAFSPDGTRLAAAARDGFVRLWDVAQARELCAMASVRGGGSMAVTPEGDYRASRTGTAAVAFSVGDRGLSFEQFDLRYNRPDKVVEALGGEPLQAAALRRAFVKRLAREGRSEPDLASGFGVPSLRIANRAAVAPVTDASSVELEIEASDPEGRGLDRVSVWTNGVPAFGSRGWALAGRPRAFKGALPPIGLVPGSNRIEISVRSAGGVESLRETVDIECVASEERPRLFAVCIGVSRHAEPGHDLEFAAKDANDVFEAFSRAASRIGLEPQPELRPLVDAGATRERILAVRETLARTRPGDTVVLFVAGHGMLDADLDYFFAPHDMAFGEPRARGLAFSEIEGLLDGIPARRKLLLMDTCHAGEVDPSPGSGQGRPIALPPGVVRRSVGVSPGPSLKREDSFDLMRELFVGLERGSGSQVISASGGYEFAFEREGLGNGVFTFALLEALGNPLAAESDGKPGLTVSELRRYLSDRVRALTNSQQSPTSRREEVVFDFRIG